MIQMKKFKMPNAIVILFGIIVIMTVLTWIVPAGNFERVKNAETGITVVNAASFRLADERTPVGPFEMFLCIQKGFVESGSIIFLIFFAYFCVYTVTKTGSLHAAINVLLKKLQGRETTVIVIFMILFSLAGSTYGEWDTVYGLVPIFVGIAIAMGYDALVGLAMSGMAVGIGFASATTNPFTIGIAQAIAELPIFSGILFRLVVLATFTAIGIWWTLRYAKRVKRDPKSSYVYGVDMGVLEIDRSSLEKHPFTAKRKFTILLLFATIIFIVFATLKLGWYLDEMSAVFLFSGFIISLLWKMPPDEITDNLIFTCRDIIIGALIVGMSRSIMVVLAKGNILDTIIYGMYQPLQYMPKWLAAEGMLIFQNIMNLFIPSGSGQAAAVMPIMIPLSDLVGLNRQIAILAYQFGDGYSNLFWPVGGIIIMAAISRVPIGKWYKFFTPLFGIMLLMEAAFIALAVAIGYGPF
ncbi:YfcC family protein [Cloacibacillus sp.]